jgi:multidrug efflux system membrane fusion protein
MDDRLGNRNVDSPFPLGGRWAVPHTPFWLRIVWIALGVGIVLLIVWWATSGASDASKGGHGFGAGGPIPVGVAHVTSGDVHVTIDGLGAVTPLTTVTVHPQVTGYLNRFDINEGQMVKAGQLLAEIDPRPFQAALDQAKGQLARDQSSLTNARIDLGRYQALWKQNAVSQQILQTQIATVGTDQGTVVADRAAVESAAINLQFCRITSPVAGRVGLRQVDPGNLVVSGGATAIIVVTELQPISVLFSLPEDSIDNVMRHVNAGEKLAVTAYDRSMTTKLADGTLSNVDNEIDPTTGMVKMRAMFDNPGLNLFPSQFVNIRMLLDTLHNQTYVPAAAIQHGAQGTYVYAIDKDHNANMRIVKTGVTDGDKVAITDGVSPGEVVVVDGADRLKDGATVSLPGEKGSYVIPAASAKGNGKGKHGGHHRHHQAGGGGQ